MNVVDCFRFFAPYNEEMVYLRINLLKDYVDRFIILESNKTHAGVNVERKFLEIAKKHSFPMNKITYIQHNMPEDKDILIDEIDVYHAQHNNSDASLLARARERLQMESIRDEILKSSEDDTFIYSDADEIIKPEYINWLSQFVYENQDDYVRIPMINLSGRADLRLSYTDGTPVLWDNSAFFASKKIMSKNSIIALRSAFVDRHPVYMTIDGNRVEDMGWHFSWMGSHEHRKIKTNAWGHANDHFSSLHPSMYSYKDYEKFSDSYELVDGNISPDGNVNHIIKDYPTDDLPDLIFDTPFLKDFLFAPRSNCSEWDEFINDEYNKQLNNKVSDIYDHLPDLYELANECNTVIEMGSRSGSSTRAFLKSNVTLRAYDLNIDNDLNQLFKKAKSFGKDVEYIQANVLDIEIDPTDMLFIDTWHTRKQLKAELNLHANKVKKYLVFHDTHTYGTTDEKLELDPNGHFQVPGHNEGLLPVIIDFIIANPQWKFKMHKTFNNGLTVLERGNE